MAKNKNKQNQFQLLSPEKYIRLTDEEISSLMTAMEETEKTEKEAARQWVSEHRELVDSWIPVQSQ